MNLTDFENCIKSGARAHLVGIGGVSMSPLAEVLYASGVPVSGSDMSESDATRSLRALGIPVAAGHAAENIDGAGYVIRTAAARDDNVEIKAARARGLPVFERAEAWGHIMRGYRDAVCVSGAHGKTTTTSMVAQILLDAKLDPTVMIGGTLPALGSGYRVGGGGVIVLESCEYYNSFHSFSPTVAVILNVDADHLDFFKDLEDVKASFRKFASLTPERGYIVCNGDDENTMDALAPLGRELFTFGFGAASVVRGVNVRAEGKCTSFDVQYEDRLYCRVKLRVPGRHNIANALAAAAVAVCIGLPGEAVEDGLSRFTGAARRFQKLGELCGAEIYDDYAHHPNELRSLLDAVQTLGYERVLLAFQPHTFTRTAALFDDFARELARADHVYLADIYAAREKNTVGITSKDLARAIPGAAYCPGFADIVSRLAAAARRGDIILTVGAGDIYKVGEQLAALPTPVPQAT
ncbi:MAG: UDP-N-acetylmuramate--L-alanine ligase [Oscillospiraceae bacterium]|jgi:UDP-N-acetylmuramate--alanine ligase|nr:UDP-N-acetylmuramate--L-alanine ligase [Oscillospiraceae bacterium]